MSDLNGNNIDFDKLAQMVHETAASKGFWTGGLRYDVEGNRISYSATVDRIAAKLCLVHSEVTEVLEAIRKEQGIDKIVDEFADIIIRVLDLYAAMWKCDFVDVSLQDAINRKMKLNKERPAMHGHKWG